MSKLPIQFEWHGPSPTTHPDRVLVPISTPGVNGLSSISDGTALGLLTHINDPAFLLVGNAAGDRARKLTPTGWGLSNLLASVPAGRVPFSDANGLATSNAGLSYDPATGFLRAGRFQATSGSSAFIPGGIVFVDFDGSDVRFRNTAAAFATTHWFPGAGGLVSTAAGRFGWSNTTNAFTGTIDTEASRISAGFVGLGSLTNKVSIGHNGTSGTINTATGNLVLSAASGPSLTVRTDNTFDIGANGTHTAGQRMALGSGGLNLVSGSSLTFASSSTQYFTGVDLRIRRSSANTADFDTGTDGAFADVRLRNLTASGNGTFAGLSTIPAGLGVSSSVNLFGLNGVGNSGWGQVAYFDANGLRFTTGANGAGTVRGMEFSPGGTLNLRMGANTVGFYGVTPVARQAVSAAATDPATTMALVNELRADLIALGLLQ